jgi:large subunit ribosomal protein L23
MNAPIIIRPYITEKTMNLAVGGWFSFVVATDANKAQIAKTVKELYKVTPVDVRTIVVHGKTKRVGKKGKTVAQSFWKKATVKLAAGQTIDAFQMGEQEPVKK